MPPKTKGLRARPPQSPSSASAPAPPWQPRAATTRNRSPAQPGPSGRCRPRRAGGGKVVETEGGDDGAPYSVEVRLDDGSQVEVNLDKNFNVIGHEADDDGSNDSGNDD